MFTAITITDEYCIIGQSSVYLATSLLPHNTCVIESDFLIKCIGFDVNSFQIRNYGHLMKMNTLRWAAKGLKICNVRYMTSTEVATALRPFYFAVHPDLFGQYPNQRAINENSLKHLSSFLETLQNKTFVASCSLQFYIRDKKNDKGSFRLVKITLSERNIREVVLKILKACDLGTEYLDKLPKPVEPQPATFSRTNDIDLSNLDPNDTIFGPIAIKRKIWEAQDALKLEPWIAGNSADALEKAALNRPVHEEIEKLKAKLLDRWKFGDVKWECGWNETHFRGCLQSFLAMLDQHPEAVQNINGRILVFAPFTGVSLDGNIMINSGEVRHNWLDLIKNVRKYDEHLLRIPAFEKSVSQVLRNIKIARRKFMPKILAGEYERNLSQITTALNDYLTYRHFPKQWPKSLEKYELVVETEAGPLMVSPTGQLIVPSSCPGSLLVGFLTDNMDEALNRTNKYKSNKHIEKSLKKECIAQLELTKLTKDDNVTPDHMIECCEKLLQSKIKLNSMKGIHLNISTYYSVLYDGVVCIPWNWKL